MSTNVCLWWLMGLGYGVMRVGGTLGDIIRLLGTIHWPLEHIYTQDKSLTSNLLILLFFSHFWAQMSTNVCLWWPMGLVYGVMRVGATLGDIIRFLGTIHLHIQHMYTWDKSLRRQKSKKTCWKSTYPLKWIFLKKGSTDYFQMVSSGLPKIGRNQNH